MNLIELILIGTGLSMDAFAVSICKGLHYGDRISEQKWKLSFIPGLYFGLFQALMSGIGFFLGEKLQGRIEAYDHWVTFVLLAFIGIGMIKESGKEVKDGPDMRLKAMIPLAVATSIDALTVGVGLGIMRVNIWVSAFLIGITTFILSAVGFRIGNTFGSRFKSGAEVMGGIILILIGLKILLEHLEIIAF